MKSKIWLLFYTVIILGTILLLSAIYFKYEDLIKETEIEQVYISKSFNNHLASLLYQYETIHDLVAQQYLNSPLRSIDLNAVVSQNSLLYNMTILSPDGVSLIKSDRVTHNSNTNRWLLKASNNESMVIGPVYFDRSANIWLIPLYKRIVDSKQQVIALFVSTLELKLFNQQWNENSNSNTIQVALIDSLSPLFNSHLAFNNYPKYYASSINVDPTAPRSRQTKINDVDSLLTTTANARYQFIVAVDIPLTVIQSRLIHHSIFYNLFYLLLILIAWGLVRCIINIETSQLAVLTYKNEHDTLTGLLNRNALKKYAKKAKDKKIPFSLIYLGLDKFKHINDTFGHSYGDRILVEVSQRISQSIKRYNGIAIRYSGDEFVLLIKTANKDILQNCASLLLQTLGQPYLIDKNTFRINSSIGIACYPEDAQDLEKLLSYADNSMSVAKQIKKQYLFFSKSAHHQLMQRVKIEQALHHAIERQEISLVYQPQLTATCTLFGVEALVRWHHPDLGWIQPNEFIPIAEEMGLMPKLGLYILHKAMQEVSQLQQKIGHSFALSINVSVRQFIQIDFIDKFLNVLEKYDDNKLAITIEITESLFIENLESLLPLFYKIKHHQITLSLDDFGTGYSSLSLLRDVPIDELKIDKSFVDHIATNSTDRAMVESIIGMGKKLGLSVLAEGVEDSQQASILLAAGCDLFQGYYFSKPLTITALEEYCLNNRA